MPQFEYTPINPNMYDRPRCPKCTTQMYLARIESADRDSISGPSNDRPASTRKAFS